MEKGNGEGTQELEERDREDRSEVPWNKKIHQTPRVSGSNTEARGAEHE